MTAAVCESRWRISGAPGPARGTHRIGQIMSLWAESGKWGPQRHPAMTGKPWSVRRHRRVSCCGLVFFVCDALVWCACFCAGIRVTVFVIHALRLCVCLFAGIRALLACFRRCPCAGRHLLFFAAAKKSRQKKAANTASASFCLRAPTGSYASHGNHVTHVRCQRSCGAPHPLHAPALRHAVPDIPPPPRWQTVCRP